MSRSHEPPCDAEEHAGRLLFIIEESRSGYLKIDTVNESDAMENNDTRFDNGLLWNYAILKTVIEYWVYCVFTRFAWGRNRTAHLAV